MPAPEDQPGLVENLLVGHGLVDDPTETIGPGPGAIVIDRSPLLRSRVTMVSVRSSSLNDAGLML